MAVYVIRLFNQLDFVKQWFARFGADRFESVAEFFFTVFDVSDKVLQNLVSFYRLIH